MCNASPSRKVLVKRYWLGPVVMLLPVSPFENRESCTKKLDKVFRVIQDADLPLDLGGMFVCWVSEH